MKTATVVKIDDKTFRLMLGDKEIGTSKTDFDARFHMHAINDALQVAYLEGQKTLERMVEKQRLDAELDAMKTQGKADMESFRQSFERMRGSMIKEDYPGQAYFWKHNANIKRAEENWVNKAPNHVRTSPD